MSFTARHTAGICPICVKNIQAGEKLTGWGERRWAHDRCATEEKRRRAIRAGETFAGQKSSDWRRRSRRE